MKKLLLLAVALFALEATPNVMAEEEIKVSQETSQENLKWELDPNQQKVTDDNGNEIPISIDNDNKITITLPTGWSFWLKKDGKNYNPISINDKMKEEYLKDNTGLSDNQTNNDYSIPKAENTSPKLITYKDSEQNMQLGIVYNDNQASSGLPINIKVEYPSEENQRLTLVFKSDEGVLAGSIFLRDSQTIRKEKEENEKLANEKRKKHEEEQKLTEQKLAEETYLKYIEYDNNQPWHKRVGDGIQGHLANFKGWLRG
ncbi:phage protein [Streptococcus porcinus]|uniref:hypothetical protein n=1 Tax=Streptococcus porcinus TaxID=1340 RepID=UPI0010CAB12D|nr:hypothetical protein [Streptococcus porcinus]VTS37082.1 phage protein [Streptococcus porcinus]